AAPAPPAAATHTTPAPEPEPAPMPEPPEPIVVLTPEHPASLGLTSLVEPLEESDPDRTVLVAELAIPEYDQLSASQVLPLLEGLAPGELEAIGRYELEHRARSSVLAKVDQLTG